VVVGYALAGPCDLPHPEVAPGDGELKRLYLLRAAQNHGLGGRLFEAALGWLLAEGPRTVWIGVWSENYGAQRFYARRRFERIGEYGFPVGDSLDKEFILRRRGDSFPQGELQRS
jgi:GNAT superfamily N-acetyltransferase